MSDRINLGKLKEIIPPLDLLGLQLNSYKEFLQQFVPPSERKKVGLEAVFQDFFPIEDYDNKYRLEYVSYRWGDVTGDYCDCIRNGTTYGTSLYLTLRLMSDNKQVQEGEVYLGEFPLMTDRASFVVNGAERVVVSQLHRSPGISFDQEWHPSGKRLHAFRIIPDRGVWVEVQFDANDLLYVYLDRRRRRYRFLITTLLRAFGFGTNEAILKLFYKPTKMRVSALLSQTDLMHWVLTEDVIDVAKGLVLGRALEPITKTALQAFQQSKIETISVVDASADDGAIVRCLRKDGASSTEDGLCDIYRLLHPGETVNLQDARAFFQRSFYDPKRYDLTRVGRYRLNEKLGLDVPLSKTLLQPIDIAEAVRELCRLRKGQGSVDDIDFLGNRRVRLVGELVAAQCRSGLARMERIVRERMAQLDRAEGISLKHLVDSRAVTIAVIDFFARNPLSQLTDQINPLSEITHKRRLSALGAGGLDRERAGLEVRDVHTSHYGRICPIETPEGSNIGLINSLTTYARINELGLIETPYRRVHNKVVTDEVDYLTAEQEKTEVVAQADSAVNSKGCLEGTVMARKNFDVCEVKPEEVTYMEVSPKQVISAATALIPFLEHDDASRALMGSNMLRQAVPLLRPEAPFVGTGLEETTARDSRVTVVAEADGKVAEVSGTRIVVTPDGTLPHARKDQSLRTDPQNGLYVYPLRKFARSNAMTCFNARPSVRPGDTVKAGQVLADGGATDHGETALGRNVLVAYLSWKGYNFEDAVILSERMVSEDVYTSIHIEEYEIVANDTKLGMEEITRDIPNVGEEALKHLDRNGIVCIGSEVHPASDRRRREKKLIEEYRVAKERLRESLTEALSNVLLGEKIPLNITSGETGEVIIQANRKITKTALRKLAFHPSDVQMEQSPIKLRVFEIITPFVRQFDELEASHRTKLEDLDAEAAGTVKSVKVWVAVKRKICVGDKMAGRHGNKGVVARVVPVQDIPLLEDGTPVDMILNPLGVPSRMNIGQILETHLGLACKLLGIKVSTPVFDGASDATVRE